MKTIFRVVGITLDRRDRTQMGAAAALAQQKADQQIEQLWRARVAANATERAALPRRAADLDRANWDLYAKTPRPVGRPLGRVLHASAFLRPQAE